MPVVRRETFGSFSLRYPLMAVIAWATLAGFGTPCLGSGGWQEEVAQEKTNQEDANEEDTNQDGTGQQDSDQESSDSQEKDPSASEPTDRYEFSWGLIEGQELKVEVEQNMETRTTGGLQDTGVIPLTIYFVQDWVVEAVEKKARVRQTFRQLRMKTSNPTVGDIQADTVEPPPESLISKRIHSNLRQLVGRSVKIKMSKMGDVEFDQIVPLAGQEGFPAGSGPVQPKELVNLFSQVARFDGWDYGKGGHWNIKVKVNNGNVAANLDLKYVVAGRDKQDPNIVLIDVEPILTIEPGQRISIKTQSGTGQLRYSLSDKLPVETGLEQHLVLEIKPENPDDPVVTQSIDTTTTVRLTLLKSPAVPAEETLPSEEKDPDDNSTNSASEEAGSTAAGSNDGGQDPF